MKQWYKSKIILLNLAASLLFGLDAVATFINSNALDGFCEKRSAIASGVAGLSAILRIFTWQSIGKENQNGDS